MAWLCETSRPDPRPANRSHASQRVRRFDRSPDVRIALGAAIPGSALHPRHTGLPAANEGVTAAHGGYVPHSADGDHPEDAVILEPRGALDQRPEIQLVCAGRRRSRDRELEPGDLSRPDV